MKVENPYKGLFPYNAKDEKLFFGREKETADLMAMIKNNQLVVLYGESGTGKTSLINARLFPELLRQYYFPVYIRINYLSNVDPLSQLQETVYSKLKEWDKTIKPFSSNQSLIDYAANTTVFNGLVKPILFFDQFEELFTLGQKYVKPNLLEKFIIQVADLVEMRMLSVVKPTPEHAGGERNDKFIDEEFIENAFRFTVVFSLRQDYIGQLDDLKFKIPSVISNRYRIKKFDSTQALEAIIKPASVFSEIHNGSQEIIDNDTAYEIIHQLRKLELDNTIQLPDKRSLIKRVISWFKTKNTELDKQNHNIPANDTGIYNIRFDPTVLSLYCYQLYNDAKPAGEQIRHIILAQVEQSPGDKVIKNYYQKSLSKRRARYAIEKLLITPDGRRVLMSKKDFITKSGVEESAIEELKNNTGIIRIYGDGKEKELELAHDRIARRALISKKEREANRITLVTSIISLGGVILIGLSLFSANKYIETQEKQVEVAYLREQLQEQMVSNRQLTSENNVLYDSLSYIGSRYIDLSSTKNILVTDNDKASRLIKDLQRNLRTQLISDSLLQVRFNVLDNNYKTANDSLINIRTQRESLLNRNAQQQTSINSLTRDNRELADSVRRYRQLYSALLAKQQRVQKEQPQDFKKQQPEQQQQQPTSDQQKLPNQQQQQQQYTGYVLWIDDHPVNHAQMAKNLKAKGINVIDATNNADALNLIQIQKFDLIVSDINRDGKKETGLQFLEQVKDMRIPAIIYTTTGEAVKNKTAADQLGVILITGVEAELENTMRRILRY